MVGTNPNTVGATWGRPRAVKDRPYAVYRDAAGNLRTVREAGPYSALSEIYL